MSRSIPRNCNLTAITPTKFFVFETNDIHQRLHALKQFYCPNLLVQTANSFTTCQICSFLRNLTVLQINRNSGTLRDYTTRDAVVFSGAKGVRQEALTDSRRRNDRFKRGVNQLGPYVGQWFSTGAAQLNVKLKNSYWIRRSMSNERNSSQPLVILATDDSMLKWITLLCEFIVASNNLCCILHIVILQVYSTSMTVWVYSDSAHSTTLECWTKVCICNVI